MLRIFAYGTLKRGECREHCWPLPPQDVQHAWIHATLYDLGEYPAILPGDDRVVGEIWTFPAEHAARTLEVLDQIEDYREQTDDLYRRCQVTAWLRDRDERQEVLAYFYWQPQHLTPQQRVQPCNDGLCTWSGHNDRPALA